MRLNKSGRMRGRFVASKTGTKNEELTKENETMYLDVIEKRVYLMLDEDAMPHYCGIFFFFERESKCPCPLIV